MTEPGAVTLWVQTPEGTSVPDPRACTQAEMERHVLVMRVVTESNVNINLVFRRGEFSKLCANPNDPSAAIEVAVHIEE